MGSGKSTTGKLLAEKLKKDFIDLDIHIEETTGKTIKEIFDTEGEESFRFIEHEFLKKLMSKNNVVISLGGGTPCFYNTMELINQNGTSVYIEMGVDTLVKRLSKVQNKRPLIRGINEVDLKYFINTNIEDRLPFYGKADYIIQAEKKTADELAEIIEKLLKK
jgi:shikimate kinase